MTYYMVEGLELEDLEDYQEYLSKKAQTQLELLYRAQSSAREQEVEVLDLGNVVRQFQDKNELITFILHEYYSLDEAKTQLNVYLND